MCFDFGEYWKKKSILFQTIGKLSFMTCTWPSVHRLNIPASPEETNARDHTFFVLSVGLSLSCISIFSFFFLEFLCITHYA
jgi:hypothetical protein